MASAVLAVASLILIVMKVGMHCSEEQSLLLKEHHQENLNDARRVVKYRNVIHGCDYET